ncbi:hypothetical protein AVEN_86883-1, partial [Araneus ventricosus]
LVDPPVCPISRRHSGLPPTRQTRLSSITTQTGLARCWPFKTACCYCGQNPSLLWCEMPVFDTFQFPVTIWKWPGQTLNLVGVRKEWDWSSRNRAFGTCTVWRSGSG